MKPPSVLLSLIAVMQTTALTAGSITVSSGNVQTAGNQVITGNGARAQATVDQRGSVVRLGSNTAAQVGDRGDVSLSKGVVLISSGDGFLRRPAVQVTTPQGDVTVRGSAIVAALPDGSVKMTCLEGSVRGDLGGQNMALNPGNLIVQRPEGTRDTVQVNLNTLTHSSTLLDNASFKQPLPSAPEIRQEVAQQAQALQITNTSTMTVNGRTDNATGSESKEMVGTVTGPKLILSRNNVSMSVPVIKLGDTSSFKVSGEVSGNNILLNTSTDASSGSSAQSSVPEPVFRGVLPVTNQMVVANGNTQQIANGTMTLAPNVSIANSISAGSTTLSNASVISGTATLVRAGSGTLTLSSGVQNVQGATLNNGTLVLQGGAAQQFTSGALTVTGPGGAVLTPINNGGVLTFQSAGGGAPASAP